MGPISWGGSNNTHFFLVIFRDFRENMCIVWVGNVMTPEKDIQRFEMSKVMAICYFSFRYKRIQIKDIYVVYLKQAIHDLLMLLLLLLFLVKKQRSPKVVDFGGWTSLRRNLSRATGWLRWTKTFLIVMTSERTVVYLVLVVMALCTLDFHGWFLKGNDFFLLFLEDLASQVLQKLVEYVYIYTRIYIYIYF